MRLFAGVSMVAAINAIVVVGAAADGSTSKIKTVSGQNNKGVAQIVRHAVVTNQLRRLDQQEQQDGEEDYNYYAYDEDDLDFLMKYSMKFVSCKAPPSQNNNNGLRKFFNNNDQTQTQGYDDEGGTVRVRLCPSQGGGCNSYSSDGCLSNYGDIVISTKAYAEAWVYARQGENNYDYNDGEDYYHCHRYYPKNDDRRQQRRKLEGEDGEDDYQYNYGNDEEQREDEEEDDYNYDYERDGSNLYVGPVCTNNGKDIKLAFFNDSNCEERLEEDDLPNSNWALPYQDGGLVPTACLNCNSYYSDNNDNNNEDDHDEDGNNNEGGEEGNDADRIRRHLSGDANNGELMEICEDLYQSASYKCETGMKFLSNPDEEGCQFIQSQYSKSLSSSQQQIMIWTSVAIILLLLICCYCAWWRKSKLLIFLLPGCFSSHTVF